MKKMKLGSLLLAGMAIVGFSSAANATTLTLNNTGTPSYQQTLNSPCVIGDPSCSNPTGFLSSTIPPSTSPYDVTSPTYTVGQIETLLAGNTFMVGIDVNTATGADFATEFLNYFALSVDGTVQFSFGSCCTSVAGTGTQLINANNGNGYSDALLSGFNLSSFSANQTVTFRAIVNSATDGREEFFLINPSTTSPVPEPASLTLLGSGLAFLATRLRRKKNA
jgi:hypothetical protein